MNDAFQGKYRVELDSTVMELDGFAEELGTMQTVLYSQTGLNNALEHVLVSRQITRVQKEA